MGGASDDTYRLRALRKLREQQERGRQRGLADAVSATAVAGEQLARRVESVERAQAAVRVSVSRADERAAAGEASVRDLVGAQHVREQLEADVARARETVAQAEAELLACGAREDEARAELVEAARERKAIEVHYERWEAERAKQRARKQEQAADEIAQMLHRRK